MAIATASLSRKHTLSLSLSLYIFIAASLTNYSDEPHKWEKWSATNSLCSGIDFRHR